MTTRPWLPAALLLACAATGRAQTGPLLPEDEALGRLLDAADAAREAGEVDEALAGYREALDRDARAGYRLVRHDAPGARRWVGVTEAVRQRVAALPAGAVERLRAAWDGPAAEAAAAAAVSTNALVDEARVLERFPRTTAAEALEAEVARLASASVVARLPRGDPANRAVVDAEPTIGAPRFEPVTLDLGGAAVREQRFAPGAVAAAVGPARLLPLVHGRLVLVPTADQVLAFDVNTGAEARRIPRAGPAYPDPNPKVQLTGVVAGDLLAAPLVHEVLRDQQYRGIPIKVKVPLRKLAAFDLAGWRWAWNHGALLKGTELATWSFGPPTVGGAALLAPSFDGQTALVNARVSAFDPATGAARWTTWVVSGGIEQTMFGEMAAEPLMTPLAVAEGVVYHSSSFGVVAALDALTGRPLWVTEYPQLEVRAARGYYPDHRQIGWENNAPVVEAGVVVAAPLDSAKVVGLDARTGALLWIAPQRAHAVSGQMKYVMGASEGAVVLAGGGEARCLDVRTGKLRWVVPFRGRTVAGRGCIARGLALVPLDRGAVALIELETGRRVGELAQVGATGNVMLFGEHAVVTGEGRLAVHRLVR